MVTCIIDLKEIGNKKLNKFLSNLSDFLSSFKDSEVIFVVKSDNNKVINQISSFIDNNDDVEVKIIYSSKTLSTNKQLKFASILSTKNYVWLLDPNVEYNKSLSKNICKTLKNNDIDLIEIKPKFNGWIKWDPRTRHNLKPSIKLSLSENEKIVAYTFPFLQNKIFTKKILSSIFHSKKLNDSFDVSTNLTIEFLYLYLLKIKTYVWIQNISVTINILQDEIPYFKHIFEEWNRIDEVYYAEEKYISEIKYAKVYYLFLIITSFYGVKNINTIFKDGNIYKQKYFEKLLKLWNTEFNFFETENKYMINKNEENQLLNNIPPINKWNKLLSFLEN